MKQHNRNDAANPPPNLGQRLQATHEGHILPLHSNQNQCHADYAPMNKHDEHKQIPPHLNDDSIPAWLWGTLMSIPEKPRLTLLNFWKILGFWGRLIALVAFFIAVLIGIWVGQSMIQSNVLLSSPPLSIY